MSTEYVDVYVKNGDQQETARRLLDAAGTEPDTVDTITGGFRVPAPVAAAAGYGPGEATSVDAENVEGDALRQNTGAGVHLQHGIDTGRVLPDAMPATTLLDAVQSTVARGEQQAVEPPAVNPEGDAPAAPPALPEPVELKGEALDQALRDANLSTDGRADEKRARLAEFRAALPTNA